MGKLRLSEKELKGSKTIRFRDKETDKTKGVALTIGGRDDITVTEEELKKNDIHILDKVCIVKKDDTEEEIGTVNNFYKETESND